MKIIMRIFPLLIALAGAPAQAVDTLYYYHNDHLGTPQMMTDQSQQVVWQADYRPFGEVAITVATIENNLRFPGQYYDEESGLNYNYFRDYDPSIGRYVQSDPIGLRGGINTYSYVGSNPLKFVDPFGLSSVTFDPGAGTLTVYSGSGENLGTFDAANNAQSSSEGAFPQGTYDYSWHSPHSGSGPNNQFGSYGNFIFEVPGRIGMGVHSGRENECDKAKQCGVNFSTNGCIRTTDAATQLLHQLHFGEDPLTHITVE